MVYEHKPAVKVGVQCIIEATRLFEENKLLAAREFLETMAHTIFGPKRSLLAATLYCIALRVRDQSKYDEAENILRTVLNIYEEEDTKSRVSVDDMKKCLWNLGFCLWQQAKYSEAESMYLRCKDLCTDLEGDEDALELLHQLATCLRDNQKMGDAIVIFRQCYNSRVKLLGENHNDTMDSLYMLACCLYDINQYDEAEGCFRCCYDARVKVFGEAHDNTINSLDRLAMCLRDGGQYDKAADVFERILEVVLKLDDDTYDIDMIKKDLDDCRRSINK